MTEGALNLKINGEAYSVQPKNPYTTLNDFIREQPNLKGTKHNCGQGGCGVCVVVLTRCDPATGARISTSINSCLRPLAACNNMEVTTVEGLGSSGDPHPVQQSFADNNASQCGFCTSGQIMSVYGELQKNPQATKAQLEEALDGNLCRCTGYFPIVQAATSLGSDYVERDTGSCCSSLKSTFGDIEEIAPNCSSSRGYCHKRPVFKTAPRSAPLNFKGWTTVASIAELDAALASAPPGYRLVAGNTSSGIYPMPVPPLYIDISQVAALRGVSSDAAGVTFGALTTISELQEHLLQSKDAMFVRIGVFIKRIASAPIRNMATWAGNFMLAHSEGFASDLLAALVATAATLRLTDGTEVHISEFLRQDMSKRVVASLTVPYLKGNQVYFVDKVAQRSRFSHSFVNISFKATVQQQSSTSLPVLFMGGLPEAPKLMPKTMAVLAGHEFTRQSMLNDALSALQEDIGALPSSSGGEWQYRRHAAASLLYKLVLFLNGDSLAPQLRSAVTPYLRPVSTSHSHYANPGDPSELPISAPVAKVSELEQVTGEAVYSGDEPVLPGTMYCAPVITRLVGDIASIDASAALSLSGVRAFLGASDLRDPAFKWGIQVQDQPLFASARSEFSGQLVGCVVADSQLTASMGANLVSVKITPDADPLFTIDQALKAGSFMPNPTPNYPQSQGDLKKGFSQADHVITGTAESASQLHFQMEPHTCYVIPEEGGAIRIIGAFQSQTFLQQTVCEATGLPHRKVTVQTRRLGGGYGSKITTPSMFASMTSVASLHMKCPVKCTLRIETQSKMCGGRNPMRMDYKVGYMNDGTIVAADLMLTQQSGSYLDGDSGSLNIAVVSSTNVYNIPNFKVNGQMVKCNLPPFQSTRGPGWAQGVFLCEAMVEDVAFHLGVSPISVKKKNFYKEGQLTPYGMPIYISLDSMVDQLLESSNYTNRAQEIATYNKGSMWKKRGISVVPVRFSVNNSRDPMSSTIAIYADGTLSVETGGIEMGQGLHTKVAQSVAMVLKIPMELISITATTSFVSAGSSITGGSVGSEISVVGAMQAAGKLLDILDAVKVQHPELDSWAKLCAFAVGSGIDLRATGWGDIASPKTPDSYETYGACVVEVLVDLLTGEHFMLQSDIVMDLGISMNPLLDVGQIQGAFVMGAGLFTTEQVIWDSKTGAVFSDSTWTFKPWGVMDIPVLSTVTILKNNPNPRGVLRSKAVGEPPLLMGCSALFAIKAALQAGQQQFGLPSQTVALPSPASVPNVLNTLVAGDVSTQKRFVIQRTK